MVKGKSKNEYATKGDINDLRTDMGKEMKELRKDINEDFKYHVGTIYEKFHGDIKLVIEYQQGMDKRLA